MSLLLSLLFFGCCLVVVWWFGCCLVVVWLFLLLIVVVGGVVVVSRISKDSTEMGSTCPCAKRDLQTPKAAKVLPRKIDSISVSKTPI